ncbi:MAG: 1-deoxy-D-xylulose-5-phosphate synthase [Bacteroidales bacterium]|nr:1-deoxy-D-xylulose-5-phosphate synthase [Bacteroidales bacterium]
MEKQENNKDTLLSKINSPVDLKKLEVSQLPQLCDELRDFIVDTLADNPGHFGASLGVVEMTVALHYVYNTPDDKLVWDVGHQAYGHKILTGRKDNFHSNRKYGGVSGFPKISESEYDAFGVGHSSTSISAALGMAVASRLQGNTKRKHIAIIGDGSLTGGEAFEALNNAGVNKNANLLVVLNDNGISIDKGVGSLKEFLLDVTTSKAYNKFKDKTWNALGVLGKEGPAPRNMLRRFLQSVKTVVLTRSEIMESMNMRYFGPVDGHDVVRLVRVFKLMKNINGPKLLHVITKKGKGFKQAEIDQTKYHAPGKFNKATGDIVASDTSHLPPKYQDVFGETIVELAEKNNKIVGITPAMLSGSSLNIMMEKMPKRTFDVGIAEQHAVTFSAGLAAQGLTPFCNIYSTFLQRAYDQVIHDVALQKLNVVLCIDRGGLVGEDGPTHHGAFDLAYLRLVPNMVVAAPMNEMELRNMMFTAQKDNMGPIAIRYPRGRGVNTNWHNQMEIVKIGKGRVIRQGKDLAIITIGHVGNFAAKAADILASDGIEAELVDFRFLKPIDEELLHQTLRSFDNIITVEDGTVVGGLGSLVAEFINKHHYKNKLSVLGIPDRFIEHGTPDQLHNECGFDTEGIYQTAKKIMVKSK